HDDEITTFLDENGVVACFPMGNGRIRLVSDALNPEPDESAPTADQIQQVCDKYIVGGAKINDPVWLAYFRINKRCASGMRFGNVFICGDAAHIHSPVGEQGMNTGLQDAFNVAWKLALVINGQAAPSLLDSYEKERH